MTFSGVLAFISPLTSKACSLIKVPGVFVQKLLTAKTWKYVLRSLPMTRVYTCETSHLQQDREHTYTPKISSSPFLIHFYCPSMDSLPPIPVNLWSIRPIPGPSEAPRKQQRLKNNLLLMMEAPMLFMHQNMASPISIAGRTPESPHAMYLCRLFHHQCNSGMPAALSVWCQYDTFSSCLSRFGPEAPFFFTMNVLHCIYGHPAGRGGIMLTTQAPITLSTVFAEGLVLLSL